MQYRSGTIRDRGNPFGVPSSRQDRLQDTTLSFGWQPLQKLSLSADMTETIRSSNLINRDFTVHLVTFTATLLF
jgi:hypothetical protein